MEALELIRWQTRRAWEWLELTVSDVTPEQAKWKPPGVANTIASNYAHTVMWADVDINHIFYKRAPVLAGDWASRLRCEDASNPNENVVAAEAEWSVLREYGQTVHRWIVELVDGLTADDLERQFQMVPEMLGLWTGLQLFDLHCVHHIRMHGGEISCLKGLQGGKGYLGGVDV